MTTCTDLGASGRASCRLSVGSSVSLTGASPARSAPGWPGPRPQSIPAERLAVGLRRVWNDPAHALVAHRSRAAVIVDVPVQYYQSVIATEVAVTGVLLFQIRFFDTGNDQRDEASPDPRLRLLMLIVLTATLFGSLEAIRESAGRWAADTRF